MSVDRSVYEQQNKVLAGLIRDAERKGLQWSCYPDKVSDNPTAWAVVLLRGDEEAMIFHARDDEQYVRDRHRDALRKAGISPSHPLRRGAIRGDVDIEGALLYRAELAKWWASSDEAKSLGLKMRMQMDRAYATVFLHPSEMLRRGDPFVMAPAICQAIEAGRGTFPDCELTEAVIPAPSGYMAFGQPPSCTYANVTDEVMVFAWYVDSVVVRSTKQTVRGVVITYYDTQGIGLEFWPFGEPWRGWGRAIGLEASTERAFCEHQRYCFIASMHFMAQKLSVTSPRHITSRHVRRQLQRIEHQPTANVVELRAREHHYTEREGESRQRDWSVQWFVRGHWRNQWYPSLGTHQPKWIAPYVKGPEDKPVKTPRAQIFAVVR